MCVGGGGKGGGSCLACPFTCVFSITHFNSTITRSRNVSIYTVAGRTVTYAEVPRVLNGQSAEGARHLIVQMNDQMRKFNVQVLAIHSRLQTHCLPPRLPHPTCLLPPPPQLLLLLRLLLLLSCSVAFAAAAAKTAAAENAAAISVCTWPANDVAVTSTRLLQKPLLLLCLLLLLPLPLLLPLILLVPLSTTATSSQSRRPDRPQRLCVTTLADSRSTHLSSFQNAWRTRFDSR